MDVAALSGVPVGTARRIEMGENACGSGILYLHAKTLRNPGGRTTPVEDERWPNSSFVTVHLTPTPTHSQEK
jgi:hypothetical protein